MNPQPHPIVGQFGVLIFALLVAYFCFNPSKKKSSSLNDSFALGYIYDNVPLAQMVEQNNIVPVQTKKPRSQPNKIKPVPSSLITPSIKIKKTAPVQTTAPAVEPVKQEEVIDEVLFNDCMLALMSLGTKKAQSKAMTKKVFDQHKPKTIEEFIQFVYLKS